MESSSSSSSSSSIIPLSLSLPLPTSPSSSPLSDLSPLEEAWSIVHNTDKIVEVEALNDYLKGLGVTTVTDLQYLEQEEVEVIARVHLRKIAGRHFRQIMSSIQH